MISYTPMPGQNPVFDWNEEFKTNIEKIFNRLGVIEVKVNSLYRENDGNHATGRALDIHSIVFKDGKELVFHFLNRIVPYNKNDNKSFLAKLIKILNALCFNIEVYSPEYIYKNYDNFLNRTNKLIKPKNYEKCNDLDWCHHNHLHLAINSKKDKCIPSDSNKDTIIHVRGKRDKAKKTNYMTVVFFAGIGFAIFYYYKEQENEQEERKQ